MSHGVHDATMPHPGGLIRDTNLQAFWPEEKSARSLTRRNAMLFEIWSGFTLNGTVMLLAAGGSPTAGHSG